MKFLATLPEQSHYVELERSQSGRRRFADKAVKALEISMPPAGVWSQPWKIITSKQHQKGDKSKWPYKLVLRLYEPDDDTVAAVIEREEFKGVFAWSEVGPMEFYAFPKGDQYLWISYSFHRP